MLEVTLPNAVFKIETRQVTVAIFEESYLLQYAREIASDVERHKAVRCRVYGYNLNGERLWCNEFHPRMEKASLKYFAYNVETNTLRATTTSSDEYAIDLSNGSTTWLGWEKS